VTLLASANGAEVHHCDWRGLLPVVDAAGGCDALIVDAPYSSKVHDGHDGQVAHLLAAGNSTMRSALDYAAWTPADVLAFVNAWSPLTRGWMVSVTDHVLAPAWEAAFNAAGRYAFYPLPFVAAGSRIRLAGDGPSCWTCQIVVARPRTKAMAAWGTLRGAYVLPEGASERQSVVGGKPTWLGRALVADYSRPGDLVVDPCCGAGTFPVSAIREGRRAIGGDAMREHAQLAADWIQEAWAKSPKLATVQPSLFGAAL
jgi:site-specific DNA-methyltransferase (adenine-specific)